MFVKVIVKSLIKVTGFDKEMIHLEMPDREEFGDYSSNVAMQLFSQNKEQNTKDKDSKSPRELAEKIIEKLKQDKELQEVVDKIEVAGPGFINFWLKREVLIQNLQEIIYRKKDYGEVLKKSVKKVIIEHTQPNTNKPNHIGHLRNSLLGMSLVRLYSAIGYDVVSTNVNNDRGIANIKGMWAYLMFGRDVTRTVLDKPQDYVPGNISNWKDILNDWNNNPDIWKKPEDFNLKPDVWVGKFYIIGNNLYKDNESVKEQMYEMLRFWEESNEKVLKLWKKMNGWFYEGSWQTLKRIGVSLDVQEYESELYKKGKEIVVNAINRGVKSFSKLESGAVQVNLEQYGLPNKILVRSDGTAIYMTFDIELTRKRSQDMGMDFGIWVVANDQILHFQQLFAICQLLGFGTRDKWHHLAYGYVFLPEGKMSSREGRLVTIDELLDSSVAKARNIRQEAGLVKVKSKKHDKVDEVVGLGAVTYSMLNQNPMKDMVFNMDNSVSFEGNSGPYIQYTYARARSVTRKAGITTGKADEVFQLPITNFQYEINAEELSLLRHFIRFSEIISMSAKNYSPNILCNYLYDLASKFNLFYQKHGILEDKSVRVEEQESVRNFRLVITLAIGQILKNGLNLLGIQAPERM